MFSKNGITFRCETTNFEKVRDYMEYACRSGYKFNYEDKYAADVHYYQMTIELSGHQVEQMAVTALTEGAQEFHDMRNRNRKAEYEDARRDGYAKAVEDQAVRKRAKE